MADNNFFLNINNLKLYFKTSNGIVRAVDSVLLGIKAKEAVVVVGESGCGKSSLAKAILRLLPRNVAEYSGNIFLRDVETMSLTDEEYRKNFRWIKMSLVPQAAMNALNPVIRVGEQVAEPLMIHFNMTKEKALEQATTMFQHVGVPNDFINRYPFELSGGMCQRITLAMSLVINPELIILDEPTSALDVLTQANIFNLLKRFKAESSTSFMLITHDIATSSELADRVAVMYAGQIVEVSDSTHFFTTPRHPYSEKLMDSVPRLHGIAEPNYITGQPPSLINPPAGCRFADRCPKRFDRCSEEPPIIPFGNDQVKCWLYT